METTQQKIEYIFETAVKGGFLSELEVKEISALGIYGHTKSENKWPRNRSTSSILLDPLFFQAIALGRKQFYWQHIALKFHKINLTQSFSAAIDYLFNLIKN